MFAAPERGVTDHGGTITVREAAATPEERIAPVAPETLKALGPPPY
ncbi:hypothetical protein AB0M72_04330 [Nocardiopsis dassonvillei]|nr:hypothetical protein [Nocardiopsis dassonvillei]MCK9872140.1 hypothetical protein [Nocardiopsis dassonvillei]